MKKVISVTCLLAVLVGFTGYAMATMWARTYTISVVDTASASNTFVLRGEIYGIHVDVPTGATGTVNVIHLFNDDNASFTILNKASISSDTLFCPRQPAEDAAGADVTYDGSNEIYVPFPMAGKIKITVTGESAGTNEYKINVIYKQ